MTTPLSTITPAQQTTFALGAFAGLSSSVTGKDPDQATYQLITAALDKAAPATKPQKASTCATAA